MASQYDKDGRINGLLTPTRRKFLKGTTALGLAAGFGTSLLPGLGHAAEPKKGGKLRVGMAEGGTTDSLNPQTYTDTFMLSVGFATHGSLTEIAPSGELIGDLAESWEASADAVTWTFKIRKGVDFSDGKTMDADDVIASLNYHRGEASKSAAKANVDPIKELKKIDSHTVAFVLDGPNADFPYLIADYHLLIMPARIFAGEGEVDWSKLENYIGTGGYVLEHFEPGVRAALKRNPNYWKPGRAHVDEIEFLVIADSTARQNALISKEVDMINRVDLKTVDLMRRRPGINIEESTGFLHYTAPMITTSSPYDNNELRLAIKHGINREELFEENSSRSWHIG